MTTTTGMRRFALDETVDAVVIGTGAGGAPLLSVLAARGLRVVALEAGAHLDPLHHTADETAATEINWMEERLSAGTTPTAFGPNNSGRGVGGSTLHWGAFTPRPDPRDLRLQSEAGVGRDWPITSAELTPYLERVEADIGVAGPTEYPWDRSRRYQQGPLARNASADMMLRGCAAIGMRATDAPTAVLSAARGGRPACVNCGQCHQGCRTGAKASMDTTYLPEAVRAGAEIRADSFVHGIELDAAGRVSAVLYTTEGVERRQRCSALFLCAGGVETPRLLLHTGLANGSGQVGRNFLAHGATQVWGAFESEMRGYRGYPSSAITEDTVRPTDADFAGGYLIQSLGVMPLTYATSLARGGGLWGRELMAALDGYRFAAGVGINAECLPAEGNRLELSDERDEHGVPKARITFSAGSNEEAIERHAIRTMTAIVEAAGATSTRVLARTAHTLGTVRMGADRDDAVVDADGRSFDVPNLWVCDNSVFPSALIANPALTTMALSLRTADRFLA
ncbi:GMC family oxidoreductase [Rathayibacter tanaceti]|uniref:Fructose dehydrogenase large subunit n=2 Tax=Rathayibacter tanaceti TaxID=1671680 RepID=A0A166H8E4_9MICO|nr:GMC family oxidoreductase [Rathayibacter tanaceti]KZX20125.1 Fructose dehydrogenase large subunit [Rathayibacter tanaceti]QHC56546.1 GMC family oxidoreductase [Rathayibacter tanaceti]TCO36761.1 choline dehydrogenase-like flavoprotein [Rathayibacter tanaceti]